MASNNIIFNKIEARAKNAAGYIVIDDELHRFLLYPNEHGEIEFLIWSDDSKGHDARSVSVLPKGAQSITKALTQGNWSSKVKAFVSNLTAVDSIDLMDKIYELLRAYKSDLTKSDFLTNLPGINQTTSLPADATEEEIAEQFANAANQFANAIARDILDPITGRMFTQQLLKPYVGSNKLSKEAGKIQTEIKEYIPEAEFSTEALSTKLVEYIFQTFSTKPYADTTTLAELLKHLDPSLLTSAVPTNIPLAAVAGPPVAGPPVAFLPQVVHRKPNAGR